MHDTSAAKRAQLRRAIETRSTDDLRVLLAQAATAPSPWRAPLAHEQAQVDEAAEVLRRARQSRASVVAAAYSNGATIYGIAKALGLTQNAVRKMLGL